MSTMSLRASRQLAERADSLGAQILDAPVSVSIPQAESGTLAITVGGGERAFGQVEPVLRALGQTVTRVGANGEKQLAMNSSVAVETLAFSEGLLLAERGGADPQLAAEVISTSSIGSPMLKARVPVLLDLPGQPWFDVALMEKTIRLAREAAGELEILLPSAAVADRMLVSVSATELGYGHRELVALHEVLAESAAA